MHRELEQTIPFLGGRVTVALHAELPEGEFYDKAFQSTFDCAAGTAFDFGPPLVQSFARTFGEPGQPTEGHRTCSLQTDDNELTLVISFAIDDVAVDADTVITALCAKIIPSTVSVAVLVLYTREHVGAFESAGFQKKALDIIQSRLRQHGASEHMAGNGLDDNSILHHPMFEGLPAV